MGHPIVDQSENEMKKTVEALKRELSKVRTGRASAGLVDGVKVDYYGSDVPLNQVANVSVPDARTIQIVPWEPSMVGPIEKAILAANLGFTPQNDGKNIRIPLPALTEERRKEIVKLVKKTGEDTKVSIRNHRREGNDKIKSEEKNKKITEDDVKKLMDLIQTKTDTSIAEIDKLIVAKEKEILTV